MHRQKYITSPQKPRNPLKHFSQSASDVNIIHPTILHCLKNVTGAPLILMNFHLANCTFFGFIWSFSNSLKESSKVQSFDSRIRLSCGDDARWGLVDGDQFMEDKLDGHWYTGSLRWRLRYWRRDKLWTVWSVRVSRRSMQLLKWKSRSDKLWTT